jgi:4-amino-4-deoxy-L-arabinose transferase-like glycosyltransferase
MDDLKGNDNRISSKNIHAFIIPLVVGIIFFCFVLLFYPFRERLQFDYDEGINLIVSMLIKSGYPLYEQVSSDQPALFAYLLAAMINLVGINLTISRILILIFSSVLVWACAQFLQLVWGSIHSVLMLFLIILLPFYMQLSVSIMFGLPAIAMAILSLLALILWHLSKKNLWLILSAIALGISIHIKLFTAFLVPIFLIGISTTQINYSRGQRFSIKWFKPAIIWGISFSVFSITLGLSFFNSESFSSIVQPHYNSSTTDSLRDFHNTINYHLLNIREFVILALIGVLITIKKRNWLTIYPISWFIIGYLLLNSYSPVWYHQQLLVTVPITMLAAVAAGEAINWTVKLFHSKEFINLNNLLYFFALLGLILVVINFSSDFLKQIYPREQIKRSSLIAPKHQMDVLRAMRDYADYTNWIVTDMPIYAALLRKPVPPDLATFTLKRLATKALTEEEVISSVKVYKPEQVLLTRFNLPKLEIQLMKNYSLILEKRDYRLYVRNDIYVPK